MNYPAASERGIKKRNPEKPSPQSGGVCIPKGNQDRTIKITNISANLRFSCAESNWFAHKKR